MSKKLKWFLAVLILFLGFAVGFFVKGIIEPVKLIPTTSIRENTDKYKFIHPLLAIDRSYGDILPAYQPLYDKIQKLINNGISSNSIMNASVYFIDYSKFGSFTINKDEKYSPASLLKVMIMISYLKKSESTPELLKQKITYEKNISKYLNEEPFVQPTELEVGQAYSVEALINKMIIDSDNGAMELLLSNISNAYLNQVYNELGLSGPTDDSSSYTISVKDYSLFFRVLYNATYLSSENSEKAMSILSQTTFADGLTKNLPKDLIVAHKFGEHINSSGDNVSSVEFHDCGIVYSKKSPYLLCIMTKGANIDNLHSIVSKISKDTYDFLSNGEGLSKF